MILFCENAVTLTFDLQNLISENVHLHSHSGYVADAFVQSDVQEVHLTQESNHRTSPLSPRPSIVAANCQGYLSASVL